MGRAANGEGSVHQVERTVKHPRTGEPMTEIIWRAVRTVDTVKVTRVAKRGAHAGQQVTSWEAKKVSGVGRTRADAIAAREKNYKRYLVETGQASPDILETTATQEVITFADLLNRWFEWKKATKDEGEIISPSTAYKYKISIDNHLAPSTLGRKSIRLIKYSDLDDLLTVELPNKKKADGSPLLGSTPIRQAKDVITMAFEYAKKREWIVDNKAINLPTRKKQNGREGENLQDRLDVPKRLLAKISGTPDGDYWALALMIGMRQSERLGVTFDAIENLDLADPNKPVILTIEKQLWRDPETGAYSLVKTLKSERSKRRIALPTEVANAIRRQKARQLELAKLPGWNPPKGMERLMFSMDDGRQVSQARDTKRLNALLKKYMPEDADLRGHALRHLAITAMVAEGQMTPEQVATVAGHSKAVLEATYLHLSYRQSQEGIERTAAAMLEQVPVKSVDETVAELRMFVAAGKMTQEAAARELAKLLVPVEDAQTA